MSDHVPALTVGSNVPNSVADVFVEFPSDWMEKLRAVSPISRVHSFLVPYWYRAGQRWVLYDAWPEELIDPEKPVCVGFTGAEFFSRVQGKAPRDRAADDFCPYVSDVQYEFYRLYRVYARPYWVLQGETGGHQVTFGPFQQQLLAAKGLPTEPPQVGTLDPCPFDNRVVDRLRELNRLVQMGGKIESLRKSSSKAYVDIMQSVHDRELREAELKFLETQMASLLDAAQSVSHLADSRDHLMYVQPGTATHATDALEVYRETGDFIL